MTYVYVPLAATGFGSVWLYHAGTDPTRIVTNHGSTRVLTRDFAPAKPRKTLSTELRARSMQSDVAALTSRH
ncbi:hypothetical protein TH5_05250 [Thalassospira xianhensis MCCC 1A02616]|uniref:Uncharacterized protein n=1 Tax=Thalassospira xianhensis MCCC 1A02616 TaxID=1177929 RepID=A0A367UGZ9_9PROT|nr:hypothetical protein TH5_05250 [Thalassospira xianhensis MCCC 1A02616]